MQQLKKVEMFTDTHPEVETVRSGHLAEKIVFVDGLWGCGKTMLSPIVAAFDRVELMTYAYEVEQICSLFYLNRISRDATQTMIRALTDRQLYDTMMGRSTNFRFSDLSSAFMDAHPWRYIKRLFQKGDEVIPERIKSEKPILHLTTHHMLGFSEPIYAALDSRVVFIELVRHPLYMIKQQALNMERLLDTPRDFTIYYDYKGQALPYFLLGREEAYLAANPMERAIFYIEQMTAFTEERKIALKQKHGSQIVTIPFEIFVLDPEPYLQQIETALETKLTKTTRRMLKKQKVPRKVYSDGLSLDIYKRCGWEPPKSGTNQGEFAIRRSMAAKEASPKAMEVLDRLCATYEKNYLS